MALHLSQKGKNMITFIDFLILLTILAIIVTYFTCFKDYTLMQLLKELQISCRKGVRFIFRQLKIWYLRSINYFPFPSFEPFVKQVLELHICKIFKLLPFIDKDKDIWLVTFRIRGIVSEYLNNLDDLTILLTELLHDFLIAWFGAERYPFIYCISIREGEIVFWIAKNAYGNQKITDRMKSDEERNLPNVGDIDDD